MTTKERIILESAKLFLKHGYSNVSLNMILDTCHLSKGGFYHYFPSKESLFRELLNHEVFGAIVIPEELKDKNISAVKKMKLLVKFSYGYFERIKGLIGENDFFGIYPLVFQGIIENKHLLDKFKNLYIDYEKFLEAIIDEGKNEGEFKEKINSRDFAYQIISSIEGIFLVWSITKDFDLKKHLELVINNIIETIKAKEEI
ncbi:MAG: TetR family transcriptional regulator [Proteobacteria bacterium]|nr:TetR family transcriptional regulator [Pseudomonadota bacterium]